MTGVSKATEHDELPETHSLGDLRLAAERAVTAGEVLVSVNAKALLALCRSESWAHTTLVNGLPE